jgi:PTS system mannose-specific IIA component
MVGVVLVAHCNLAHELVAVLESIVGKVDQLQAVVFDPEFKPDTAHKKIATAVKKNNSGDGVLILTDMFGGTPSNISLSFLEEGMVEVVTGVNLPMLIRMITLRENKLSLAELSADLQTYGKRNICIASELLKRQSGIASRPL